MGAKHLSGRKIAYRTQVVKQLEIFGLFKRQVFVPQLGGLLSLSEQILRYLSDAQL